MAYDLFDFTESLAQSPYSIEDIERVSLGFGENGDYSEWEGGFVFKLKAGTWVVLTGWCDTTGWGCQDGIEVHDFPAEPTIEQVVAAFADEWNGDRKEPMVKSGDPDPADLNRYVRGEIDKWEDPIIPAPPNEA